MSSLVYFVRHGQTEWNAEQRLQGQADTDITEVGRVQADRNGRRLAELIAEPRDFDFVASPMRRTRETMERARAAMGLEPHAYRTDARLVEVHFGDWQGFTFAELEGRQPGCTAARLRSKWDFVPPGAEAESYKTLLERISPWFDEVNKPTVCVTHGGVLRVIFRLVQSMPTHEAAVLEIPQDRILRMENGRLDWL
jgi:probable phosphoglycerate mutase